MDVDLRVERSSTAFEREIRAFLCAVAPKYEIFAPHDTQSIEFTEQFDQVHDGQPLPSGEPAAEAEHSYDNRLATAAFSRSKRRNQDT
jgi:hypothetical protein